MGEGKGTNHTVPFCHRAFYPCFSQLIPPRAELWCGNRQGKKVQFQTGRWMLYSPEWPNMVATHSPEEKSKMERFLSEQLVAM